MKVKVSNKEKEEERLKEPSYRFILKATVKVEMTEINVNMK